MLKIKYLFKYLFSLFIFHQYDFQTYASDSYRSQCFKYHDMFDFAYKLHCNYIIIFIS